MANKYNSRAWKQAINARRRIRRKIKHRVTTPTKPRTHPETSEPKKEVPKKGPMSHAEKSYLGGLTFLRNCLSRKRKKDTQAANMKRLNDAKAAKKTKATDTLIAIQAASVPEPQVLDRLNTSPMPIPNPNAGNQLRSNCPKVYHTTSKSHRSLRRRIIQSVAMLHPSLRMHAILLMDDNMPRKKKKEPLLDLHESLKVAVKLRLSNRNYRLLARKGLLVSERKKEEKRKQLFSESGYVEIDDPTNQAVGMWRTLRKTITDMLLVADWDKITKPIRVVVTLDGGGTKVTCTKIGVHLADNNKPTSAHRCGVYAIILGCEKYETLAYVINRLDSEIAELLQNGIEYENRHYPLKFFFVADMKASCMCLGLQGGSALFPCPFCLVRKDAEMNDPNHTTVHRTMAQIKASAQTFYEGVNSRPRGVTEAKWRQLNHSISDWPLLRSIEISEHAPPVLHVTMGAVNAILGEMMTTSVTRAKALLKAAKVTTQNGRKSDLTGTSGQTLVDYCASLPAPQRTDPFYAAFAAVKPLFSIAKIDADYSKSREIVASVMAAIRSVRHVATKLHVLERHVCDFIDLHKTWGRVSEQGIESLHKHFNQTVARMPGQSNIKRIKCFLKDHLVRNAPNPH